MNHFAPLSCTAFAVLALGISACGGDLMLPDPPNPGVALRVVEGDEQRGIVGEALPLLVVVEVKTDAGVPIANQPVAFASDNPADEFDPDTAVTNGDGQASTRWKLGTQPGPYVAEARVVPDGDTTVTTIAIRADAIPGDPDTLRAAGPVTQSGSRERTLDEPLRVVVVDRFGNPVGGADVEWKLSSGDAGSLSAEQTQTAPDGTSSVTWTLGDRVGVHRVEARVGKVSGSPVTFTAIAWF